MPPTIADLPADSLPERRRRCLMRVRYRNELGNLAGSWMTVRPLADRQAQKDETQDKHGPRDLSPCPCFAFDVFSPHREHRPASDRHKGRDCKDTILPCARDAAA